MRDPIERTGVWVRQLLQGYLHYFAVSGNDPSLWWFYAKVRWRCPKVLEWRSQQTFLRWPELTRLTDCFFPPIRCCTRCPVTVSTPKPERGARCVSSTRRDLCGGQSWSYRDPS
jgi:hypothetical protein